MRFVPEVVGKCGKPDFPCLATTLFFPSIRMDTTPFQTGLSMVDFIFRLCLSFHLEKLLCWNLPKWKLNPKVEFPS